MAQKLASTARTGRDNQREFSLKMRPEQVSAGSTLRQMLKFQVNDWLMILA